MTNQYVIDTHALYWYLTDSPRLGGGARAAFDEALTADAVLYVPVIVLAELYSLNEKAGRPVDFGATFIRLRDSAQFAFVDFQPDHVLDFADDTAVPEMHDRMIVGVTRRLGATCVSRDLAISASGLVPGVW